MGEMHARLALLADVVALYPKRMYFSKSGD